MTARQLVAEALGTALLVAVVVGSGIMASRLTEDTALALLANALATGAGLYVLITVFAPVSGAEFNPVVTLLGLMQGRHRPFAALLRIIAQVGGGAAGTILTHAMFGLALVQAGATVRSGGPQWLAEGVATFGLVLAILGAGTRAAPVVACYITAAYWFTASTSFANPAVTIARALTDSFAGIRAVDAPGFILAQLVGAGGAALLGPWLFRPVPATK